ncbi:monothiol glutaredoxin, Grx4 family [Leptospira inadai serovar Lyme str. 10]|uniref:Glutaredoxin n=2 Tax=Leptospira inadai serovar Lyme TaxID=293084 RepID=V6HDE2_9LEPT|nr:Grx4 family monothiol glutaredoxin [Leptospira inadai]EQA37103.1 monothiol glutaredoxin, Grx4 family [Leptospira inadai serovar Lyme str. 10]PNV76579.1 monothiol glutaredoxin, Grx4 family [Leptospira inadai serovar Lyme]
MDQILKEKIQGLIDSKRIFLFMKGTPEAPMCGFSAGVTNVLRSLGVDFGSFNVLSDQSVREGIKEFANWPTIPQLYIEGEFIGGHDIVVELSRNGELQKKIGIPA